jgi:putative ABC transport system permease protein
MAVGAAERLGALAPVVRSARRRPGFFAFAVASLGLGIGASTAVYAVVQAVLLRALPFREPERLVWMYNQRTERDRAPLSLPDLADYERENRTLEALAPFTNWTTNLTGVELAERLEGVRVDGRFFGVLGAPALLGRTIAPDDALAAARVAVLTHGLWLRRFGADPRIVGRAIRLNGAEHEVIGVMPRGFVFPFREAELAVPLPLATDPRRSQRGANFVRVVARLRPGVTIPAARAELDVVARRLQRQFPDEDARKTGVSLYPLHAEIVGDYRRMLWTVFAAVLLLFAVGCGNLADLMLVRAAERRAELALRALLGASRPRLLRLLLAEAAVVAAAGGLLGTLLAVAGVWAWRTFGPAGFPRMSEVAVDWRVVGFACSAALAVALLCGAAAAGQLPSDSSALGGGCRSVTAGRRHAAIRRGFVALQLAGSALLLACMGLAARGFARLERVEPGFADARAVTLQLSLPPARFAERKTLVTFYEVLRPRFAGLPGVRATGAVSLLPLSGLLSTADYLVPDRPAPRPEEVPQAHFRIASPGYFEAAGVPVLEGREFSEDDRADSRPVAVVSRTLAERTWPGASAIGHELRLSDPPGSASLEVVGVVGDVQQFRLDAPVTADLYMPLRQIPATAVPLLAARMYWVVATRGEDPALGAALRREVRAVDPEVAASATRTLAEIHASSLAPRRIDVRLLELFAPVALSLAALGVYGVTAFSVGMRRRELALRSALGARRGALVRLVLREELRPALLGLASGLLLALAAARAARDALFATSPSDPVVYAVVTAVLVATATLACYLPARRAARVDPAGLLRA